MERGLGRVVIGGVVAALAISGCNLKGGGEDLVNGKELFVQECAACHVLKRAGPTGVTGPDLDAAFKQSRADGLGESTFRGVVEQQILHPNINQQVDPKDRREAAAADAGEAVEGDDARDVAAYVAQAVSKGGRRSRPPGRRRRQPGRGHRRGRERRRWTSPSPPPASRTSSPTPKRPRANSRVTSENPQSVPHDIAVEGNGVNEKGEVVQGGGTSEFSANLQAGEYTFFCSVPGHREGGMEGKLTVE